MIWITYVQAFLNQKKKTQQQQKRQMTKRTTLLALLMLNFCFCIRPWPPIFFKVGSTIDHLGAKFNERLCLNVSIQSRRRKNTKDRKQKPEIWFSMCKILHLRKKKGKLLSGKYYRDRCLTSSAFQCLIVKTVKKKRNMHIFKQK